MLHVLVLMRLLTNSILTYAYYIFINYNYKLLYLYLSINTIFSVQKFTTF